MRSTSTRVATFQNTRVCHGPIRCDRPAVEADDGELVGLGLDRLEQLGGEIGPRRLEHGVAIRRELGAHDRVQLDRELAQRIEQTVAARLEHLLEPAVAREEGALAVLHRHAQHEQVPVHGTRLLHWPRGGAAGGISSFEDRGSGRVFPRATAGRGLSPVE